MYTATVCERSEIQATHRITRHVVDLDAFDDCTGNARVSKEYSAKRGRVPRDTIAKDECTCRRCYVARGTLPCTNGPTHLRIEFHITSMLRHADLLLYMWREVQSSVVISYTHPVVAL